MDSQSGFYPAEREVVQGLSPLVSPIDEGRNGRVSGPAHDSESGVASEDAALEEKVEVRGDELSAAEMEVLIPEFVKPAGDGVEEARQPRLPHQPGRPTKREIAEHCVSHWPFRSWCRHCVRGRAVSSPHRSRTDADREFGRSRIPPISLDHCFMGSAEDEQSAHGSPILIIYDSDTARKSAPG